MKSTWVNRTLALSVVVLLCLVAACARAELTGAVSGWVWVDHAGPFAYAQNESSWLYFADTAPGEEYWFYNYSTAQWSTKGPDGWLWFNLPVVYSPAEDAWFYVQEPPSGGSVYHYAAGQWTLLYHMVYP